MAEGNRIIKKYNRQKTPLILNQRGFYVQVMRKHL